MKTTHGYASQAADSIINPGDDRDGARIAIAQRDAAYRTAKERADRAVTYCETHGIPYASIGEAVEIAGRPVRL